MPTISKKRRLNVNMEPLLNIQDVVKKTNANVTANIYVIQKKWQLETLKIVKLTMNLTIQNVQIMLPQWNKGWNGE